MWRLIGHLTPARGRPQGGMERLRRSLAESFASAANLRQQLKARLLAARNTEAAYRWEYKKGCRCRHSARLPVLRAGHTLTDLPAPSALSCC